MQLPEDGVGIWNLDFDEGLAIVTWTPAHSPEPTVVEFAQGYLEMAAYQDPHTAQVTLQCKNDITVPQKIFMARNRQYTANVAVAGSEHAVEASVHVYTHAFTGEALVVASQPVAAPAVAQAWQAQMLQRGCVRPLADVAEVATYTSPAS